MRKNLILLMTIICAVLLKPDLSVCAATSEAPVSIYTVEDLMQIKNNPNASYILENDLDMSGVEKEDYYIDCAQRERITPYIRTYNYFNGTFDGNGHSIVNMSGKLFYALGVEGVIKNVNFGLLYEGQDSSACASIVGNNCGMIRACTLNYTIRNQSVSKVTVFPVNGPSGKIESVDVVLNIKGTLAADRDYCLFGEANYGKICDCTVSGTIDLPAMSGGVIAYQNGGIMYNCVNDANIKTATIDRWGNIVGYNYGAVICCTNYGDISDSKLEKDDYRSIGGICGDSCSAIIGCSNHGNITAIETAGCNYLGGVVGSIHGQAVIERCVNHGTITNTPMRNAIIGAASDAGSFDADNNFISKNDLFISDCSNDGNADGLYNIYEYYQSDIQYRNVYSERKDIIPAEYIELAVGDFTTIPVAKEYKEAVHFVPVTYHDNSDDYYVFRNLVDENGYAGVESVENYNFWHGSEVHIVCAYTDDGAYDYVVLYLTEDAVTSINDHFYSDGTYDAASNVKHYICYLCGETKTEKVEENAPEDQDDVDHRYENGLAQASDGNWYYYVNGAVATNYTGLAYDATVGWWYVENGKINFNYNGLIPYGDAWWCVAGGAVRFDYTGLWCDPTVGWWYVENGAINFGYNGLIPFGDVWWCVAGGAVIFDYTGLWCDPTVGWWYVENGAINFGYNGLIPFGDAWWCVAGGAVIFDYTGLWCDPTVGWWYVENGTINFGYNGLIPFGDAWWCVAGGNVCFNYTGLWYDPYVGWWYVENGVINFGYTGPVYWNGATFHVVSGTVVF